MPVRRWMRWVGWLDRLVYPPVCEGCGGPAGRGRYLCLACRRRLARLGPERCERCSQDFAGAAVSPGGCANCRGRALHFETAVAAYAFRGLVREMVLGFKYRGRFYLRYPLERLLAEGLRDRRLAGWSFDGLVPVPLHPVRRRERGYNQSEELARLLGRRVGKPVERALVRVRVTETQTRFDRAERMENLRGAMAAVQNAEMRGRRLLLVDDVLTTGSTLDECARVLKEAGAAEVRALVVARG